MGYLGRAGDARIYTLDTMSPGTGTQRLGKSSVALTFSGHLEYSL